MRSKQQHHLSITQSTILKKMSSMWILLVCLAAICLPTGLANSKHKQPMKKEACSDIPHMRKFDSGRFMGTWYVRASGGSNIANSCTREVFTSSKIGIKIEIDYLAEGASEYITIYGMATPTDPKKAEGRWHKLLNKQGKVEHAIYSILATDYKNFAIAISCSRNTTPQTRIGFILTRAQNLDKAKGSIAVKRSISNTLKRFRLKNFKFNSIKQNNCPEK